MAIRDPIHSLDLRKKPGAAKVGFHYYEHRNPGRGPGARIRKQLEATRPFSNEEVPDALETKNEAGQDRWLMKNRDQINTNTRRCQR